MVTTGNQKGRCNEPTLALQWPSVNNDQNLSAGPQKSAIFRNLCL